ncbi:MAG TPA: 4-hydroxybenzoate octaprenyltransferase [Gammaproteobacteria bacterium]|jgi:4-hydroxybenzoate polyprenyltransferase|nr:4-hydroxybenzoate octaprenyltransferase [Gammaproteobacteria bacterium]
MLILNRLQHYFYLTRLNKPIGILLLFWPTAWALWLANDGVPPLKLLIIFTLGVILMRSAGCAINDIADRHIDDKVARTAQRPIASGKIAVWEALMVAAICSVLAFALVLLCNALTIRLALLGALLAFIYPFLKRITHLPQCWLGLAFSWGVPMAFAASTNQVGTNAWLLFLVAAIWPIIYDTMYAIADRPEDLNIGVKSTAILFGKADKLIIGILQILFILLMIYIGQLFELSVIYYCSLFVAALLFIYQQRLIQHNEPTKCIQAFLNNNLVGLCIFIGIATS